MEGADWLRTQLTAFGCSSCGNTYRRSQIRVLAHKEELWFVRLSCARCGEQTDAIVTIEVDDGEHAAIDAGELGSARVPLEVAGNSDTPVTADDVLAVHEFLGGFDGDFRRLFGEAG